MIFFITIGIGSYIVLGKYKQFQQYALQDRHNSIENKKEIIKDIVNSYVNHINYSINSKHESIESRLVSKVNTAYKTSMDMYQKMKADNYPEEAIQSSVKTVLASMVFGNNYIFAFDKSGVIISSPLLPMIEGKNLIDMKDAAGRYTLRDSLEIISKTGDGFQDVVWANPSSPDEELKKKRVYMKEFEPYGWVIGYGIYMDDDDIQTKSMVVKQIETVSYENKGYIFAATYDGVSLTAPEKGKDMYDVQDVNGVYIVRELIKLAKTGGGYLTYVMPPFKGARPETKISYVAPIEKWGWYVGTGVYITDIEAEYQARMSELFTSEKYETTLIISGLIALLGAAGFAVYIFSGKFQQLVEKFNADIELKNAELAKMNTALEERVKEKTTELNKLNQFLEQKVEEEVSKNRKKDRIMFQQGRLAAMGEMIGNIAHQWRQPLSSISLLVQDIQEAYDCGELDDEYLQSTVDKCTATVAHMSDTIDDFRYFFNPAKEQVHFDTSAEVKRCVNLLDAGLENSNIKVIVDLHAEGMAYGVPGEYSQVIVNVVSNAKDVLLSRGVIEPVISIKSYNEAGCIVLNICDNGGGVPSDIIDNIFEPYFTTKYHSKGTGIGLYFSKMIIEDNMNGRMTVKNEDGGACFYLYVPIAKSKKPENTNMLPAL
ncbi:cache domain-containing protein [Deferribacteres bacterium DY0609]|uniref:sensor histidine kinase n=1 Tax=Denitrovibrio acetiphilus TaxID=118000 RepID=UPI0002ECBA3A|nr:cache domain-containing protein [Denitrovibrio acetiphilus]